MPPRGLDCRVQQNLLVLVGQGLEQTGGDAHNAFVKRKEAFMKSLQRVSDTVNRTVSYVGIAVFLVLILACVMQVFFRFVLNHSLSWTEELARAVTMFSAPPIAFSDRTVGAPIMAMGTTRASSGTSSGSSNVTGPHSFTAPMATRTGMEVS